MYYYYFIYIVVGLSVCMCLRSRKRQAGKFSIDPEQVLDNYKGSICMYNPPCKERLTPSKNDQTQKQICLNPHTSPIFRRAPRY